jgi:CheY-like chemotaxis protein
MRKVFVVDDDPYFRSALRMKLRQEGYDVLATGSGLDLLRELQNSKVDAIVLDLNMPGLPGLEVLRRLAADPVLSSIPVLVATAERDSRTRSQCLALGARECHMKPVSLQRLAASVAAYVS